MGDGILTFVSVDAACCFLRACDEVGIRSEQHHLPTTITSDELLAMVGSLNERDDVDRILAKMHTCLTLCSLFLRPQVDVVGLNLRIQRRRVHAQQARGADWWPPV